MPLSLLVFIGVLPNAIEEEKKGSIKFGKCLCAADKIVQLENLGGCIDNVLKLLRKLSKFSGLL